MSSYDKLKKAILKELELYAEELGEPTIQLISNWLPEYTDFEIAKALFGKMNSVTFGTLYNQLALFALEHVAWKEII